MKRKRTNQSNWRCWNIAVTGVNARAESPGPGCAVARCIQEHPEFKGNIVGLGYDILDAGLYVREFCDGGYLIPYPSAGEQSLLERLLEIHARERLDVVIPCLDAEILNFIAIEDELNKHGIRTFIPQRSQFQMRAKNQLAEFCVSAGINAPRTKALTDVSFFDRCAEDGWVYPLVVKGIFYDAYIVKTSSEAKAAFHKLVAMWGYPALVQEVLQGDEYDVSGVGDGRGKLLSPVIMRKRALTDKGKAWAGVTVQDPAMLQVAEKLVAALRWRGPFEVEVMRAEDGTIHLIEMNPRFPAWIYLSHAAGRNLPVALLKVLNGESVDNLGPAEAGTFFIRYAREVALRVQDFESMFVDGGIAVPKLDPTRSA